MQRDKTIVLNLQPRLDAAEHPKLLPELVSVFQNLLERDSDDYCETAAASDDAGPNGATARKRGPKAPKKRRAVVKAELESPGGSGGSDHEWRQAAPPPAAAAQQPRRSAKRRKTAPAAVTSAPDGDEDSDLEMLGQTHSSDGHAAAGHVSEDSASVAIVEHASADEYRADTNNKKRTGVTAEKQKRSATAKSKAKRGKKGKKRRKASSEDDDEYMTR